MAQEQHYLPQGRLVGGNLYTPQTTDMQGRPLTDSSGKPRTDYVAIYAIPKTPGVVDFKQEAWAAPWVAAATAGFPGGQHALPTFAWKVVDGDSNVPNQNMKKPCEQQGYPGHWVIRIKGGYAARLAQINPTTGRPEAFEVKDAIVPGDYIQACITVAANGNLQKPGIYVNPVAFCLMSKGERIVSGPDVTQMAFGQPPGSVAAPVAAPPAVVAQPPAAPAVPAAVVPPPAVPVVPAPAILAPPPVPAVFPPAGWTAHPQAPGYFYKGQEVLTEADLRARQAAGTA